MGGFHLFRTLKTGCSLKLSNLVQQFKKSATKDTIGNGSPVRSTHDDKVCTISNVVGLGKCKDCILPTASTDFLCKIPWVRTGIDYNFIYS